jgi:predicted anti-sigma-YlaC factor YlaD
VQCATLGWLLSTTTDDQADPALQAPIATHLAQCERCRNELERERQILDLLKNIDDAWTPPDLRLRIRLACRRP